MLAIIGVAASCGSGSPFAPDDPAFIRPIPEANATIVWVPIEGGFWAIRGDDDVLYDPHPSIPAEFRQHGMRVRFAGQIRGDLACFHAVGPIVTVTDLRGL